MSARSKQPLWPVAVSMRQAAECLGVRREKIAVAVREGALPAYRSGTQVRVLTEDLVALVRTWERVPVETKGDPHV